MSCEFLHRDLFLSLDRRQGGGRVVIRLNWFAHSAGPDYSILGICLRVRRHCGPDGGSGFREMLREQSWASRGRGFEIV
eukprot:9272037-Pyramimonas_sp.AAC.1